MKCSGLFWSLFFNFQEILVIEESGQSQEGYDMTWYNGWNGEHLEKNQQKVAISA